MITKLLAIAGNTFLETIRQPIYGIVVILTCFLMILNCSLAAYTLSDDNLFLNDLGLSTLLVTGLFLAAFSAAGVLNREIQNKTVMTVLSKPVSRPVLIVGKFVGLISALTTAFYISTLAMLLVVRHGVLQNTTDPWDFPVIIFGFSAVVLAIVIAGIGNYWYDWQFSSTVIALFVPLLTVAYGLVTVIDKEWKLQFPRLGDGQLLAAIILILLMVWILSSLALTVSCKFGQLPTLIICVIVLMIGLTSDYLFGQQEVTDLTFLERPLSAQFSWVAYRLIPNLGIFWIADAVSAGKHVDMSYLFSALAYAVLYIIAILSIGVAVFQRREVG